MGTNVGEVRFDILSPSTAFTVPKQVALSPVPVALPPNAADFTTALSQANDGYVFSNPTTGVLKYLGKTPAKVHLSASASLQRESGSEGQYMFFGFAVGSNPLTSADIDSSGAQFCSLFFNAEDYILSAHETIVMQPGEEAQVWMANASEGDIELLCRGLVLSAEVIDYPVETSFLDDTTDTIDIADATLARSAHVEGWVQDVDGFHAFNATVLWDGASVQQDILWVNTTPATVDFNFVYNAGTIELEGSGSGAGDGVVVKGRVVDLLPH